MSTSSTRWRRAAVTIGAAAALVLTACQWSMPRFDAAGSGHNTGEAWIGLGNIGSVALESSAVVPGPTTGGTPVVAGDLVYVTSKGGGGGVRAYATNSTTGCVGTPGVCDPVWSAAVGDAGQAAVAGGVLYVAIGDDLHAYDAKGVTGCTGTPASCMPLWTAPGWGGEPVVAGERLYVTAGTSLGSFDAAGVQGCAGSPVVCQPAWTFELTELGAVSLSPPAVADGVVYVGARLSDTFINGGAYGRLLAVDAAGVDGCTGSPTTCQPLWASPDTGSVVRSPTIVDGVAYVSGYHTYEVDTEEGSFQSGHTSLDAFDVADCAEDPDNCTPLWQARSEMGSFGAPYSLAVADGFVHASWSVPGYGSVVATFEVGGGLCSIVACYPVRFATTTATGAELSVANGVLYVGRTAYDASGATGCTGVPVTCTPIWTTPVPTTGNRTFYAGNGKVIGLVDTVSTQTLFIFDTP